MPTFSATTFRTVGNAATAQNLFSIFNGETRRAVRVRRLQVQMDTTAALTAVMPLIKTSRVATAPAAGVALTKVAWNTPRASRDNVAVLQTCSSDGGALTAITGTPGNVLWQQFGSRIHTAVGQVAGFEFDMLPRFAIDDPLVLQPSEGLIVHIVAAVGTSNPATNHYIVQCAWDEEESYVI